MNATAHPALSGFELVHYLWHLHFANVIKITPEPVFSKDPVGPVTVDPFIWKDQQRGAPIPVRVALIDNGVTQRHANLPNRDEKDRPRCLVDPLDLATHPYGATYDYDVTDDDRNSPVVGVENNVQHFADLEPTIEKYGLDTISELADLLSSLRNNEGVSRKVLSYDRDFPRHGTLTAGVIGGRRAATSSTGAIEYYGADPFCEIVPINTSFSPSYGSVNKALIYALKKGAEVICMPRGLVMPSGPADAGNNPARRSRLTELPDPNAVVFEKLLLHVAKHVPVVLASGNDALPGMAYPASLETHQNPLITVGAMNGKRIRSSYSSGDPTIYAPSDDGERLDQEDVRLDGFGDRLSSHNISVTTRSSSSPRRVNSSRETPYCGWTILSTDIPGAYGATSGPFGPHESEVEDPTESSLYASFGGTSAACALVAGIVSLMQRQYKLEKNKNDVHLDGEAIKKILKKTADTSGSVDLVQAGAAVEEVKLTYQTT